MTAFALTELSMASWMMMNSVISQSFMPLPLHDATLHVTEDAPIQQTVTNETLP